MEPFQMQTEDTRGMEIPNVHKFAYFTSFYSSLNADNIKNVFLTNSEKSPWFSLNQNLT